MVFDTTYCGIIARTFLYETTLPDQKKKKEKGPISIKKVSSIFAKVREDLVSLRTKTTITLDLLLVIDITLQSSPAAKSLRED